MSRGATMYMPPERPWSGPWTLHNDIHLRQLTRRRFYPTAGIGEMTEPAGRCGARCIQITTRTVDTQLDQRMNLYNIIITLKLSRDRVSDEQFKPLSDQFINASNVLFNR